MVTIVRLVANVSHLQLTCFVVYLPGRHRARASSTPRALPTGVGAANPRCSCAARRTREKVRSVGVRAVRLPPMWYSVSGCCARAPRARARKPAASRFCCPCALGARAAVPPPSPLRRRYRSPGLPRALGPVAAAACSACPARRAAQGNGRAWAAPRLSAASPVRALRREI